MPPPSIHRLFHQYPYPFPLKENSLPTPTTPREETKGRHANGGQWSQSNSASTNPPLRRRYAHAWWAPTCAMNATGAMRPPPWLLWRDQRSLHKVHRRGATHDLGLRANVCGTLRLGGKLLHSRITRPFLDHHSGALTEPFVSPVPAIGVVPLPPLEPLIRAGG